MSAYTRAVNTRPHGSAAARARPRANVCAHRRSLWCIVMHVDKAIRRHVLRMLHARAELCTWHRTDRWTPCRFHFPPSDRRVARGASAGLSVPLFFSGFLPLFSGASGFRVAVFLRSFRYSRVVLLPSRSLALPRVSPLLLLLATSIGMSPSLLPLLFTLVFSLPPGSLPLSLYFFWLLLLFFVNHRLPRCAFVLFSELCHGHQIDLRCLNVCG